MLKLHPITRRKIERFKKIKRGYYSLLFIVAMLILTMFAEFFIGNLPLVVKYNGNFYFPAAKYYATGEFYPMKTFGVADNDAPADYRALDKQWKEQAIDNAWMIFPIIPYDPQESSTDAMGQTATPPSLAARHLLGTDTLGRDIFARIIYGFRTTFWFSLSVMLAEMIIGIIAGLLMGYVGGWFDSILQRVVEIVETIPFLFLVMIISALVRPTTVVLALIFISVGWISMTYQMRALAYKEKAMDYVLAARSMGASHWRIVFRHMLPNMMAIIVARLPFAVVGAISSLTALDYLGFGLPPPTPSWGEILLIGKQTYMQYPWILASGVAAVVVTLVVVTFVGEAFREAVDPKAYTYYE